MGKILDVLVIKAGEKPQHAKIEDEFENWQKIVEGGIETYFLDDNTSIICNNRHKSNGLALNRSIKNEAGEIIEIIAGNFVIVSTPPDTDTFESLSSEQEQMYSEMFDKPEIFTQLEDGKIVSDKYEMYDIDGIEYIEEDGFEFLDSERPPRIDELTIDDISSPQSEFEDIELKQILKENYFGI